LLQIEFVSRKIRSFVLFMGIIGLKFDGYSVEAMIINLFIYITVLVIERLQFQVIVFQF
jgi:hypothetical protein